MNEPLDAGISALENDGTVDDYCVVHLQRLANPVLPYHPVLNPYRTIDSMSSDLVSFNGVTDTNDPNAGNGEPRLTTRERGRSLIRLPSAAGYGSTSGGPLEGGPPSPDSQDETAPISYSRPVARTHLRLFESADYHPYYSGGERSNADRFSGSASQPSGKLLRRAPGTGQRGHASVSLVDLEQSAICRRPMS